MDEFIFIFIFTKMNVFVAIISLGMDGLDIWTNLIHFAA
jgi:hypothetical protein